MAILPAKPHFQTQAYAAKVLLIPGRKGIFCTTGILQIHLALIIYIYIYNAGVLMIDATNIPKLEIVPAF